MFKKPTPGHDIVRPGRVGQLAAPRAGIPLAHRCTRALRGTSSALHPNWELAVHRQPWCPLGTRRASSCMGAAIWHCAHEGA
eukprot:2544213-Pyramimonas_sp.AAC.1